ncbi:glycine--tRNA ligase subunit beta [Burkholderiales bacterium]|nr:glycine--tRNA ligase subunit beta [Burkholderiales bacterium]
MATLLVELLTEELPPRALKKLGSSFGSGIFTSLKKQNFVTDEARYSTFATPRRLAVVIQDVLGISPEETVNQKLMPTHVGFDKNGGPSEALLKKIKSLGLDESAAKKTEVKNDGKMEFIFLNQKKQGVTIAEGLQKAIDISISDLPIPKVMTYQPQNNLESVNFVRPAHRLVALLDDQVVAIQALGLNSGNSSLGHRFHSKGDITIASAELYESILEESGQIIPDYNKRRGLILDQLNQEAGQLGLALENDEDLLEEVTSLVESPAVYVAQFDREFLSIPEECLVLTMKTNQKYFPLFDKNGKLSETFLLVSNMKLDDPSNIIKGNEKVIRPRLADAQFFYQGDIETPLSELAARLEHVIYHNQLGSQLDRVTRISDLSVQIADCVGTDSLKVARAAELCKADLVSDMVGEFPELQGTMGRYYALAQGEAPDIADALEKYYRPRFAKDSIPNSGISAALALADKLDIIVGIFGIGLIPSGEKDPYALRRQAIGIVRILTEYPVELNLQEIINWAVGKFSEKSVTNIDKSKIKNFIIDRFKGYLKDKGYSIDKIEAVLATDSNHLHLAQPRIAALSEFLRTDDAIALVSANKRIKNILKKNNGDTNHQVEFQLFSTDEEVSLYKVIQILSPKVMEAINQRRYPDALEALSSARKEVDLFFDKVMVMSDDPAERDNRLALLSQLSVLLKCVGDLSELSITVKN